MLLRPPSPARRRTSPRRCSRRVAWSDELVEPVGEARLADALQPLAASLTDSSCLRVTVHGDEIVDVHGDTPLIPASTIEAADVEHGPRRARRGSHLHHVGAGDAAPVGGVVTGDVWLVGSGDPLLATQDYVHTFRRPPEPATPLETLADKVVAAGVRQVTGRVLGDESRYDTQRYVPSWPSRYIERPRSGP